MKSFYIIFFAFFIGNPITSETIIIRHDVPDEKYIQFAKDIPVISSIVKYNSTDVAGTLISDQWVLSAAHVAETIEGDHKIIVGKDSVGIEEIIIHPDWAKNDRPDIALIKLNRKTKHIKPVKLYTGENEIGKEVIVAGHGNFGTGITGVEGNPGTMRAATNLVEGATEDRNFLYWLFDSPESDNVTPLEGISAPGDSSGPAFLKVDGTYYLAGISSAQSTRATGGVEGLYGVTEYYTRVSTFIEWIEEEICN